MSDTKQTHGPFKAPHWLVFEYHPGCDDENPGVTLHCVLEPTDEQLKSHSASLMKILPGHVVESEVTTDKDNKPSVQFTQSQSDGPPMETANAAGYCAKFCGGEYQATFNCPTGDHPGCDPSGHLVCEH